MNANDREALQKLIDTFETAVANCPRCRVVTPETVEGPESLCGRCWAAFEIASNFEMEHSKFKMNDTQIVVGFKQAVGKQLTEEELDLFKHYMLQFECEDSETAIEAIRKVVTSLRMSHPELVSEWEETDD